MKHRLRGSTLVETLVMMLVAGIIFLTIMDSLTLFNRTLAQRTEALLSNSRQTAGYHRIETLVTTADSVRSQAGSLNIYRAGRMSVLALRDSAVLYRIGEFRDTLLRKVGSLRMKECAPQSDTVEIGLPGFTVRFPVGRSASERHRMALEEIEKDYEYEEK